MGHSIDTGKEIEALLQMAARYRSWAEISARQEKADRLALAANLERKARGLGGGGCG